jgi:ABC-type multidrug transport system fused ATPase/permease subunit
VSRVAEIQEILDEYEDGCQLAEARAPVAAAAGGEPRLALEGADIVTPRGEAIATGRPSPGRHCHSTLTLAVIDCHSLGIYTVILLPLLSCSAKMTVSPFLGVSFSVTPGAGLMVVGRGGSGKTSVVRVLRSLWALPKGSRLVRRHHSPYLSL